MLYQVVSEVIIKQLHVSVRNYNYSYGRLNGDPNVCLRPIEHGKLRSCLIYVICTL